MRTMPGWCAAPAAALVLVPEMRGDEPNEPTPPESEANPAIPAAGPSVHDEAFDDGPHHKASLRPEMGKVRFAAIMAKPEAQASFNPGVPRLPSFYYFEAERSFRPAATIDPDCATAYWDMAMANVNNARRAKGYLADARRCDARPTPHERLYLDALKAIDEEGVDPKVREQSHLLGLEALVQEFPEDIDVLARMAMVIWENGAIGKVQIAPS